MSEISSSNPNLPLKGNQLNFVKNGPKKEKSPRLFISSAPQNLNFKIKSGDINEEKNEIVNFESQIDVSLDLIRIECQEKNEFSNQVPGKFRQKFKIKMKNDIQNKKIRLHQKQENQEDHTNKQFTGEGEYFSIVFFRDFVRKICEI
jgi:translation initiation factor IF-1